MKHTCLRETQVTIQIFPLQKKGGTEGDFQMKKRDNLKDMTVEELKEELEFIKECLRDEVELYNFTFNNSTVHIGAVEAMALQEEHEKRCREYNRRIEEIEDLLRRRDV